MVVGLCMCSSDILQMFILLHNFVIKAIFFLLLSEAENYKLLILKLPQVPEGEEVPPPPPLPPAVEEEEEAKPEKEMWNTYTTVKGLTVSISGLKEGKRYKFRVAAKNIMGLSMFIETRQPVEIKEQMCKFFHQIKKCFCHYAMISKCFISSCDKTLLHCFLNNTHYVHSKILYTI